MTRLASALVLVTAGFAFAAAPVPSVAVLYFDVSHPDPALKVFNKAFAQLLITDLATVKTINTVERERLEAVMAELKLQHSKPFDPQTAQKLGKMLGAKYLIAGEILPLNNDVVFQARVISVATGKLSITQAPLRTRGSTEEIYEAEQKLFVMLSRAIADTELAEPPALRQPGTRKLRLDTAVKFAQALDAIDHKNPAEARGKLEQVVKEQPDFVLAGLELDKLVK